MWTSSLVGGAPRDAPETHVTVQLRCRAAGGRAARAREAAAVVDSRAASPAIGIVGLAWVVDDDVSRPTSRPRRDGRSDRGTQRARHGRADRGVAHPSASLWRPEPCVHGRRRRPLWWDSRDGRCRSSQAARAETLRGGLSPRVVVAAPRAAGGHGLSLGRPSPRRGPARLDACRESWSEFAVRRSGSELENFADMAESRRPPVSRHLAHR